MQKIVIIIIGTILSFKLKAFECHKVVEANEEFTHCQNRSLNYPLPIHVYIPKNLDVNLQINLNLHFHGHNLKGFSHFNKSYADYGRYLFESGSNTIFVVPESLGKCETYDQLLSVENNFLLLFSDISKQINYSISQVSFSGHSGAYRILRSIFSFKDIETKLHLKIAGAALFDALYGEVNAIEQFADQKNIRNESFLFYCAYVSGKLETTEKISNQLKIKYRENEQYIFVPVISTSESLLIQHFNVLKSPGIKSYLNLL